MSLEMFLKTEEAEEMALHFNPGKRWPNRISQWDVGGGALASGLSTALSECCQRDQKNGQTQSFLQLDLSTEKKVIKE